MAIIYTHQRSKTKNKPGWQKKAQEYQQWLNNINSMSTNFSSKNRTKVVKAPEKTTSSAGVSSAFIKKSFDAFKGGGTKSVIRPEHTYRENPEMLERELRARDRKFISAPLYNKGGSQLITEEALKDIQSGATRRRN